MKKLLHQIGFTIIEAMVTLAVLAIIVALAAPNFTAMIASNRLATATNDFIAATAFARNVAITRKRNTSVTAVTPDDAGNEWGAGGWVVWADDDRDGIRNAAGSEDLRFFDPVHPLVTVDGTDGVTDILFLPSGLRSPGGANPITITVCDFRDDETGRQISIGLTGRPSLNREFGC
ncbi:MAG: GspH/FimT family pseudopilin [Gammaproteobacteria bacterium]|nr:GspH/FimT family pseudopilin [Gammaproteobacteria bacterium]